MSDSSGKKILRMDQAVMLGAGCFIGGLLIGMLFYHFILGSAPAPQQPQQVQVQMPPVQGGPMVAPPSANAPDYSSQIRELKKILEKEPKNRSAWVELGNLLFDSNRHQESVDAYTKALELNPNDANVLTDRGIMFRALGNFNAALTDFRKASQVDKNHFQSLYNEGITLLHDMNDPAGALKAWEAMITRNPPPDVAAQMKGRIEAVRNMVK